MLRRFDPAAKAPRILHVNLARGWRGGEQQTWLLIKTLADRGYSQAIVGRAGAPLPAAVVALNGTTMFSMAATFLRPWVLRGFDIVHAHEGRGVYIAWWLSRVIGVPYIITRRMQQAPRRRLLTTAAYRSASFLVGISSTACASLQRFYPEGTIERVPSAHSGGPLGTADPPALRAALLRDEDFLILHAGALVDAHKGQSVLIEAVALLRKKGWRIRLVMVGDGPDKSMFSAMAPSSDWLHLPGHVDFVDRYIKACDLFVFPSRHEGLGSVLIDVMRAGRPIVASNVGGIPDLIADRESGRLVPAGDPLGLADAIADILSDPEKASRLAAEANRRASELGPEAMANRYEALYESVVK